MTFEALVPTSRLYQNDSDGSDDENESMDDVSTTSTVSFTENQFHIENPLCRDFYEF